MRLTNAIELIVGSDAVSLGPTTWADLGCGTGTFTRALAECLAAGSTIHAMDRDASALRKIPSAHKGVRVKTHLGDFMGQPWPFADLDGILMANSLHYVENQPAFIRSCGAQMAPPGRFLIVEYDTNSANVWVPYPIGRARLTATFSAAGYSSIKVLHSRPSVFRRAPLYAALITR